MAGVKGKSGRKPKPNSKRTSIHVSQRTYDWLSRNKNISAEVERMAEDRMNEKCSKCGCDIFVTETVGHCNNHGEDNWQETAVIYRCAECGEFIKEVAYNSSSDSK